MLGLLGLAVLMTLAGIYKATSAGASDTPSAASQTFGTLVGADGSIKLPQNVRADPNWMHIGSWAVVNDGGEGNGMHDVYTTPDVVDAYRQTGAFPDGAVLVKEVRTSSTELMTTGQAYWTAQPQVWFVMVKDRQNRFPANPLWGKGWGWALFNAGDPTMQVATDYETDCLGCHVPAQQDDWVYTRAYPALAGATQ